LSKTRIRGKAFSANHVEFPCQGHERPWSRFDKFNLTPPSEIFNSQVDPNFEPKCVQKVSNESSDFKFDTFFMFVILEFTFDELLGTFNEDFPIKIKTLGGAIF
jgi:hypothetical protein